MVSCLQLYKQHAGSSEYTLESRQEQEEEVREQRTHPARRHGRMHGCGNTPKSDEIESVLRDIDGVPAGACALRQHPRSTTAEAGGMR